MTLEPTMSAREDLDYPSEGGRRRRAAEAAATEQDGADTEEVSA
jgi:hypothetical protein